MVDKDKSLKVKSDSIFQKIINCFRNIFKKRNKEIDIDIEEINYEENFEETIESNDKNEFFKLYQDVKDGNKKLDDLDPFDLVRVNLMLTQEADIQINNIHKEIEHIQKVDNQVNELRRNNLIA